MANLRTDDLPNGNRCPRCAAVYLTNGGAKQVFIGKEFNDDVGLKSAMAIGSTDFAEFATSGTSEVITTTITYDGTNSSFVLCRPI